MKGILFGEAHLIYRDNILHIVSLSDSSKNGIKFFIFTRLLTSTIFLYIYIPFTNDLNNDAFAVL